MSEALTPELDQPRANRVLTAVLVLSSLVTCGRILVSAQTTAGLRSQLGMTLGPALAFLLLYVLGHRFGLPRRARLPRLGLQAYFVVQCALVGFAYAHAPQLDFIAALFTPLSYQAALSFSGRTRWIWCGVLVSLVAGLKILGYGPLLGLGLSMVGVANVVILTAYVVVSHQVVQAQARSQATLIELQQTHRQLERYAGQVEELAGIQQRNRLAGEIHDSVSQTLFSITLNARAVQLLMDKDPARVRPELERLQSLVQSALAQMRSLIAELRQSAES